MKTEKTEIIAEVDEDTQTYQSSMSTKYIPSGYKLRSKTRVYEIIQCLGHGTFGITYLAKNNENIVAIKEFFMHQFCGRDESTMAVTGSSPGNQIEYYGEKFKKEALNLKKLNHKSIVNVIEAFESNNTYYYSMEYIDGTTLDEYILSKGGLEEEEAIGCILEVAKAIKHIHDLKMLHLDLKPKNIMRRPDGSIVVIDFGLSKQFDKKGEAESSSNVGLGTPGYAPTEQVEHNGKWFAPWLDIYALGGVLFKMLTGKTPPPASEVLNIGLPLAELKKRGISKKTQELLKKMMHPKWKERIQSIDKVIDLLPLSPEQKLNATKELLEADEEVVEILSEMPEYGGEGVKGGVLKQVFLIAVACIITVMIIVQPIERVLFSDQPFFSFKDILFSLGFALLIDSVAIYLLYCSKYRKLLRWEAFIVFSFFLILALSNLKWDKLELLDTLTSSYKNRAIGVGEVTYTVDDVKFTMIPISCGTFVMGGDGFELEGDVAHKVKITNDYYIGETEVTQGLWKAVMGNYSISNDEVNSELPANHISFEDAMIFIEKLNKLTGVNFRLPTEAEWEYAAKGGNKMEKLQYSGSNEIGEVAWYDENSYGKVHRVATKLPNSLGLYDMTGNVEEWVQDYYVSFKSDSLVIDPLGVGDDSISYRVARGGSFATPDHSMTVNFHSINDFSYHPEAVGLRLAR